MNVRLVVDQGARKTVMQLRPPAAVLGRAHGNTVRIPSADVSRRHCRLLLKDGLVTLEDLDSANGTFLNGRRIKQPEYVHPGDAIEVGPVTFTVEYELTPAALRKLRGKDEPREEVAEVLEPVVDGEVFAAEGDDEDLPILEAFDAAPSGEEPAVLEPVEDEDGLVEVETLSPEEASNFVPVDLDVEDAPWQLPGVGQLRDFFGGDDEDDEDEPPTARRPRR